MNPNPVRTGGAGACSRVHGDQSRRTALTGVILQPVPEGLSDFTAAYITNGGTCIAAVNNGNCDSAELIEWPLGTIPAGGGVHAQVAAAGVRVSAAGRPAGGCSSFEALVERRRQQPGSRTRRRWRRTRTGPLSLAVERRPSTRSLPGDLLTYTLAYGNRGASSNITGTTLDFPVPPGTTFVSATGGGTLSSGVGAVGPRQPRGNAGGYRAGGGCRQQRRRGLLLAAGQLRVHIRVEQQSGRGSRLSRADWRVSAVASRWCSASRSIPTRCDPGNRGWRSSR